MKPLSQTDHHVLVTGASGFIGQYLVKALLNEGWQVTALDLKGGFPDHIKKTGAVEIIQGDINELDNLQNIIDRVDAVCHLAAFIPPDYEDPTYAETCIKSNSLATLRLALLVSQHPAQRFIYLTSGNAYIHSDIPLTENDPMYPADRATYYLSSKLVGELFVEHLRRSRHMQSLCLRISSLFGLGMSPKSVVARFMESAYRGLPLEVFDAGISTYDFVYVKDIANLIVEALKIGEPGIYNVGSGTAHSILELAQAVIDLFPERKLSINIKPSYGPIPASFSALCIDKAIRTWNFRPHTLFEGLTEYRNQMEQKIGDYRNNE